MRINRMLISVLALALPIIASCASGGDDTTTPVSPSAPPTVAAVHVVPEAATALVGTNTPLTATITDPDGHALQGLSVSWASSDPSIAVVSASGVVSASRVGTATIVASLNGKSGSATVNVSSPTHDTIIVSPSLASMDILSTAQFTATVSRTPGSGGAVTWSSSNPALATVTPTGLVTGIAPGLVGITATSGNLVTTVVVTVTLPHVANVVVTPVGPSLVPGAQKQMSAALTDAVGHPLTNRLISWSSSNTTVVSVTQSGLVTGLTIGSASISATCEGTTGSTTVTVATTVPPPPPPPPPPPEQPATGLYDDYRAGSAPHFTHIQTQITDWRIQNLIGASQRAAEYDWLVAHYDHAMGGAIDQQKSRMPGFTQIEYALYLTVIKPGGDPPTLTSIYYNDMQSWYASHPQYNLEDAFLHDAGGSKSLATRRNGTIWGSGRWFINVGDAGARAYQSARMVRVLSQVPGFTRDGVFIDEHDASNISLAFTNQAVGTPSPTLEYNDFPSFQPAIIGMLQAMRAAMGAGKMIQINTAEYTAPTTLAQIAAAGATHTEMLNNATRVMIDRWAAVDAMLASGATVQLVTALSDREYDAIAGFVGGNEPSGAKRGRIFELASYYMVLTTPDKLWLTTDNSEVALTPYSSNWIKAIEANLGSPMGTRSLYRSGTDGAGQLMQVYQRPFARGVVLSRPQAQYNATRFDESTGVSIPLPTGETWHLLHADGSVSPAITSVTLRNGEAAILVRHSAL